METKADKLVRCLLQSDKFRIVVNGVWHTPQNAIQAADIISTHKGQKLRYRRRGFKGYPQGNFAAIIK